MLDLGCGDGKLTRVIANAYARPSPSNCIRARDDLHQGGPSTKRHFAVRTIHSAPSRSHDRRSFSDLMSTRTD